MPLITDPDSPYNTGPQSTYTPPPPPAPAEPGGTTGDDFASSVAQTISEQYTAPPAPAFVGDPDYSDPTPGSSYSGPPASDTPQVPDHGTYDEPVPLTFNPGLPGDTKGPEVSVSYTDSSSPNYLTQLYQSFLDQHLPPAPTLGDGSMWFGTPDEQKQQVGWWQSEVQKAQDAGDADHYGQLMSELNRVQSMYDSYYGTPARDGGKPGAVRVYGQLQSDLTQAFMDQLRDSRKFDPTGEGGFVNIGSDSTGDPVYASRMFMQGMYDATAFTPQQADQALHYSSGGYDPLTAIDTEAAYLQAQQPYREARSRQMLNQQYIAQSLSPLARYGADPDAQAYMSTLPYLSSTGEALTPSGAYGEAQLPDYASLWNGLDAVGGAIKTGLGDAVNYKPFGGPSAKEALGATVYGASKALGVGIPGTNTSIGSAALKALDLPVRSVEELFYIGADSNGLFDRGYSPADMAKSLRDEHNEFMDWRQRNWSWLVLPELVGDPLNKFSIGAHVVEPLAKVNRAAKLAAEGRTVGELVESGAISAEEINRFRDLNPSWRTLIAVDRAPARMWGLLGQTANGMAPYAEYVNEFSKRLAIRLETARAYGDNLQQVAKDEFDRVVQQVANERGNQAAAQFRRYGERAWPMPTLIEPGAVVSLPPVEGDAAKLGDELGTRLAEAGPTPANQLPLDVLRPAADAGNVTPLVVDQTLIDLREVFPLVPPRAVMTDAPIDASGQQLRLLNFFSARDGVNYLDEIAQAGDLSSAAVTAKITAINAADKATLGQVNELLRLGRPWDEVQRVARGSKREAQRALDNLKGLPVIDDVQATGFLSADDFRTRFPDRVGVARAAQATDARPTLAQVALAWDRSRQYGVDLLRRLADDPSMDRRAFANLIDTRNLPASPAQQRYVRGLIERGTLDKGTNYRNLTAHAADQLIKGGDAAEIDAAMRYGLNLPSETGTAAAIAAVQDTQNRIILRDALSDYLGQHLPIAGAAPAMIGDMPQLTPGALQDVLARARDQFAGTRFVNAINEIVGVNLSKGSPTASAAYNRAVAGLIADAAQAGEDEASTLRKVIHDAYYSDTAADTQAARTATQQAEALPDAERAKREADMARRSTERDRLEAELKDVNRKVNLALIGQGDRDALPQLRARKSQLSTRLDAINRAGVNDVQRAPSARWAELERRAAEVQGVAPQAGPLPPVDAPPAVAGVASDHDLVGVAATEPALYDEPQRVTLEPPAKAADAGDDIVLLHAGLDLTQLPHVLKQVASDVKNAVWRRPVVPTFNPHALAWTQANWSAVGPKLDQFIDKFYSYDGLLDDAKKLGVNPTALTKGAQVATVSDLIAADLHRIMDEAYQHDRPYEFVREAIREKVGLLTKGKAADIEKVDDFYTSSKAGRQTLRAWREYGVHVLDRFEHATPHMTLGDFVNDGILPAPVNGLWGQREMAQVDRIINGFETPPGLSGPQRSQLRALKTTYHEVWNDTVKADFFNGSTWSPAHLLNELDPRIWANAAAEVVDLPKLADNIGSLVGLKYAEKIGFDPNDIPVMMKLMQVIKGNLSPLWMTIWPGYHLNNGAGNLGAQLLGATRHDMDLNALPLVDKAWLEAEGRAGSMIVRHPLLRTSLVQTAEEADAAQHAVPRLLNATPGLGEAYRGAQWLANTMESKAKDIVFSQQWSHTYKKTWSAEVERLVSDGHLLRADADQLVMQMGVDQVNDLADARGLGTVKDSLLRAQRRSIAVANDKAYRTTAETLRDYRMRNKLDGLLDHFMPVHYWTTKNMAFVTRTALDRPATILGAGAVFNAWQDHNAGLPPSLRTGYVGLSIPDGVPLIGGRDIHMRLTSLTNPVLFAVPKMADPARWDSYSDMSLPDRVMAWSKDGVRNFWQASGYRIGPQWDWAIKASNAATKYGPTKDNAWMQRLVDGANFIAEPSGYHTSWLPLGGIEQQFGRNQTVQQFHEWWNSLFYDSPYTRNEIAQFGYAISEAEYLGKLDNQTAMATLRALKEGNYDDPAVRAVIDNVIGNKANTYIVNRMGLSNTEYTQAWKASYEANQTYWQIADTEGIAAADRATTGQLRPELRWLLDQRNAGKISAGALSKALQDGSDGKTNPLLTRALAATDSVDAVNQSDATFWQKMMTDQLTYDQIAGREGNYAANTWAFGTYNHTTQQVENAHAPWLSSYWIANDDGDKAIAALDRADDKQRRIDAWVMRDQFNAGVDAKVNAASPFYAQGAKADEQLKLDLARAGQNMFLQEQAYRDHTRRWSEVRADADKAGVDLVGSGRYPYAGDGQYNRTLAEKNLLVWNDAEEAVNGVERDQKRRGWILDRVAGELGVQQFIEVPAPTTDPNAEPHMVSVPNPDFYKTDPKTGQLTFDAKAWEAARQAAALQAPTIYREMSDDLRREGYDLPGDGGITPADFLYHTRDEHPELTAWKAARSQAVSAWLDLPSAPDKDAAADVLRQTYGPDVLDFTTQEQTTSATNDYTARENYVYNRTAEIVEDHYRTLRPSEKRALQDEFPDAFSEATGTDADGSTFTYQQLDATKMTSAQLAQLKDRWRLTLDATGNQRSGGDGSTRGPQAIATENERVATNEAMTAAHNDYTAKVMLTDEQKATQQAYYNYLDEQGAKPYTYRGMSTTPDGQPMTLESAAQLLIDDPAAVSRKGFASWHKAAQIAGDPMLADYIEGRIAKGDNVKNAGVYEAQDAWYADLPDNVQQALAQEYPNSFTYQPGAATNDSASVTSSSDQGVSGVLPGTGSDATSAGSGGVDGSRVSGSVASGGTVPRATASNAGSTTTTTFAKSVRTLDPLLAGNSPDAVARQQVAAEIAAKWGRLFDIYALMPGGATWIKLFQAAALANLRQHLGDNPTLDDWLTALAKLFPDDEQRGSDSVGAPRQRPAQQPTQQIVPQSFQAPAGVGY